MIFWDYDNSQITLFVLKLDTIDLSKQLHSMYFINHPFRTIKCLFLAPFLVFCACEVKDSPRVTLDSGLKTYFQLIQVGKTGSARVQLRQLMEHEGTRAQPLFLMGLSYHKEKKYTKAVEWFEKSTAFEEVQERYPPAWHFIGWSYYYLGDVEKSQIAFEQFLEFHPDESDSLFALGLLSMERGDLTQAEDFYLRSIDVREENPKGQAKAMARLGDVYVLEGSMNRAKEMYLKSVELDADLYEAWFHLSIIQNRLLEVELGAFALQQSKQARERVLRSRYQTRFPE